jgi:hypothetical protein
MELSTLLREELGRKIRNASNYLTSILNKKNGTKPVVQFCGFLH